jgi:hypothetical protein
VCVCVCVQLNHINYKQSFLCAERFCPPQNPNILITVLIKYGY